MTIQTVNALSGYFQTLYDLNHDLITLCGMDVIDNSGQYEKYIKKLIQTSISQYFIIEYTNKS